MDLKDIKVNIRACRVNAGMGQKEWGERIGVAQGTVYNWERGKSEPTLAQLRTISNLSGIPLDCIVLPNDSYNVNQDSEEI